MYERRTVVYERRTVEYERRTVGYERRKVVYERRTVEYERRHCGRSWRSAKQIKAVRSAIQLQAAQGAASLF